MAAASRSASRRLLTNSSVDVWASITSSSRGWIAAQIDGACGPAAAGPLVIASTCVSRAMSSTGTSMRSDSCRVRPASTMATGR